MREQMQIKGISASTLKIIAIIAMTCNHIALIYEANLSFAMICVLHAFGGMTFPIMAYLLGEGYRHTTNVRKYAMRLLLFACIAELPFRFFLAGDRGNVLFTLFFGLLVLHTYENATREVFCVVFTGLTVTSSFFDWGGIGILMIFFYYILRDKKKRVVIPCLVLIMLFLFASIVDVMRMDNLRGLETIGFSLGCILTIPLLMHYNGKKGKSMKYFFYVYYPLHVVVLGICAKFL
jgi:TraX protein.